VALLVVFFTLCPALWVVFFTRWPVFWVVVLTARPVCLAASLVSCAAVFADQPAEYYIRVRSHATLLW
jgi:hypothetical protein